MRPSEADGSAAFQSPAFRSAIGKAPELRMAKAAAVVVLGLGAPVIAIAGAIAGPSGALSAGLAAALVLAMFVVSGLSLSFAARYGPAALMAGALGGFVFRLMGYTLFVVFLRPVEAIHGHSLAISGIVLLTATLACEVWLVLSRPGFFWVDASARAHRRQVERNSA